MALDAEELTAAVAYPPNASSATTSWLGNAVSPVEHETDPTSRNSVVDMMQRPAASFGARENGLARDLVTALEQQLRDIAEAELVAQPPQHGELT